MNKEIWRCIKDFDDYQISNFGRVKSFKASTPRILKAGMRGEYLYAELWKNNVGKKISIHRLVAVSFHKKVKGKNFVNHKDGNKLNNAEWNIEWSTRSENQLHAYKTGLQKPSTHQRKLTEKQVLKIRSLKDTYLQRELADRFKVNRSTIGKILREERWQHI